MNKIQQEDSKRERLAGVSPDIFLDKIAKIFRINMK